MLKPALRMCRCIIFSDCIKPTPETFGKLLASLKKHTKPVRPADLGIIGQEHFFARMEAAGGDPKTFKYIRRFGETDGVPRVIEFAFGIHRDGLTAGEMDRTENLSRA